MRKKLKMSKKVVIGVILLLILGILATIYVFAFHRTMDPIPGNIRGKLNFNVYYPDAQKLPRGYILDKNSFSSSPEVLEFVIDYNNGSQRIIFTEEQKPSSSDIQNFYQVHMPLNSTYQTAIGTATIGQISQQGLTSLPTNTNTWFLITYSPSINQNDLKQVLSSLRLG